MSRTELAHLGALFRPWVGSGRVALVDRSGAEPRRLTYDELWERARCLAGGLAGRGLQRGDRVGILADNRAEYLVAYVGTLLAGCAVVPLNTKLPAATQAFIAGDAEVRLVLGDDTHSAKAPAGVPFTSFDGPDWPALAEGPGIEPVPVEPDDVAVHIYTSGSTGRPKGVLLTHGGQSWTITDYLLAGGGWSAAAQADTVLVSAPMYHKNALMASKLALSSGGTIVLLRSFTPEGYLEAIEAERVTMCSGVPTMYALVTAHLAATGHEADLSSVRRVLIGSAPLTEALFDQVQELFPGAVVTNGYGTTEAIAVFGPHPEGKARPKISLGYPLLGAELRLVGGPDDDQGELWVRSPGVMAGYHNLAGTTAARLEDGWYKTGDVMARDADGWFFFVGRVDDMFVCAGENVYPGDVEAMLERHPAVHQAVVVPVADELKGQLPVAFVRPEPGHDVTEADVKAFALANGPAYQHPRAVWFVDEVPLASTAKIDRAALRDRAEASFRPPQR